MKTVNCDLSTCADPGGARSELWTAKYDCRHSYVDGSVCRACADLEVTALRAEVAALKEQRDERDAVIARWNAQRDWTPPSILEAIDRFKHRAEAAEAQLEAERAARVALVQQIPELEKALQRPLPYYVEERVQFYRDQGRLIVLKQLASLTP